MTTSRYISIKETAKIVRKALAEAFPKTKFSVRSNSYSMGCHLMVSWTNGPSTNAVEAVVDQFYGTGFDGSTDSTTHHYSEYNGETVSFAGSRPNCVREITKGYESACDKAWHALSEGEREKLLVRPDFPGFPETRFGLRLARFLSVSPAAAG